MKFRKQREKKGQAYLEKAIVHAERRACSASISCSSIKYKKKKKKKQKFHNQNELKQQNATKIFKNFLGKQTE